jgi:hypothetical protein
VKTPVLTPLLALAFVLSVVAAACGDDEDTPGPTPRSTPSTAAPTTSRGTPDPQPTDDSSADRIEVTGIIGSVNPATRVIEITRLSGADVRRVQASAATVIVDGRGNRLQLGDLKPSDRIIARGGAGGAGVLVASEIEISAVTGGPSGGASG